VTRLNNSVRRSYFAREARGPGAAPNRLQQFGAREAMRYVIPLTHVHNSVLSGCPEVVVRRA